MNFRVYPLRLSSLLDRWTSPNKFRPPLAVVWLLSSSAAWIISSALRKCTCCAWNWLISYATDPVDGSIARLKCLDLFHLTETTNSWRHLLGPYLQFKKHNAWTSNWVPLSCCRGFTEKPNLQSTSWSSMASMVPLLSWHIEHHWTPLNHIRWALSLWTISAEHLSHPSWDGAKKSLSKILKALTSSSSVIMDRSNLRKSIQPLSKDANRHEIRNEMSQHKSIWVASHRSCFAVSVASQLKSSGFAISFTKPHRKKQEATISPSKLPMCTGRTVEFLNSLNEVQ